MQDYLFGLGRLGSRHHANMTLTPSLQITYPARQDGHIDLTSLLTWSRPQAAVKPYVLLFLGCYRMTPLPRLPLFNTTGCTPELPVMDVAIIKLKY